ncbi:methyltransferase [Longibacter salinarum]|uniref:Methyltransferase n=1 Tax=Longibacter salinarum TaxID=1850348 RepID=A0A2A8CWD6_9BACT|nr:class I SAM-dependent methyltransferase [Longibacter salinarum]PEN13059.1 methyltransferase [Longibacter salinarum]
MSNKSIGLPDDLQEYMLDVSLRESEVMRKLRVETMSHPQSEMQIAPEQAQFFQLLLRLMNARRTLEVGVFTGYSALAAAEAIPSDGHVTALDISEEYTNVARRYWEEAGVADKIDLRIAPALDSLDVLLEKENAAETYDFAFIDADKINYPTYYELCLRLVRPGGLVVLDNTFRDGRVAHPEIEEESVQVVHDLNTAIHADDRVDVSMLPLADGVTLARKRS